MEPGNSTSSKGVLRVIGELGPAWVTSIAGLIAALATAGFFVGHATASASATAQPTVTIIKTVAGEATASPTGSSAPVSNTGSSSTATIGAGAANGAVLGTYSIDVSFGYSVPLSATKPTQAEFTKTISGGDMYFDGGEFYPGDNEQLVSLPSGTTPTYTACSTSTTFASFVSNTSGASFCVVETSGTLAGVYVSSDQSGYAVVQVNVWRDVSR